MACAVAVLLTVGLSVSFAWRDRGETVRQAAGVADNVGLLIAEHAAWMIESGDFLLTQTAILAGEADKPLPTDQATRERLSMLAASAPHVVALEIRDGAGTLRLSSRDEAASSGPANVPDPTGPNPAASYPSGRGITGGSMAGRPVLRLIHPLAGTGGAGTGGARTGGAGTGGAGTGGARTGGSPRGYAVAGIDAESLRAAYRAIDVGYGHTIALKAADGATLLREPQGDGTGGNPASDDDIAARHPVGDTGLTAEVTIATGSVLKRWRDQLWTYGAFALAACAAVGGIGALAIQRTRREREAEDALQHAYDTLEEHVHQRTAQLETANARLEGALADKEVLLKEVQHRVKNNLQVICSLLRLQAARIDESARRGFDESLRRIQTMSLLHELLHRSNEPAHLNFADALRQMCDGLVRSENPTAARLEVEAQDWIIDADRATPLALAASELVSNALLHAFPHGHPGTVRVILEAEDDEVKEGEAQNGDMRLIVRDDGVGLPPGLPAPSKRGPSSGGARSGLGLGLVQALSHQAGATLRIERNGGTIFTLSIPARPAHRTKQAA